MHSAHCPAYCCSFLYSAADFILHSLPILVRTFTHNGSEGLYEVTLIMKACIFRNIHYLFLGMKHEVRCLLHPVAIEILQWRYPDMIPEKAGKILLI